MRGLIGAHDPALRAMLADFHAVEVDPRRGWLVRKYLLGQEPGEDLSTSTTPEERLAMMWPLALEAWALSGAAIPDCDRREAPVRKLRRCAA